MASNRSNLEEPVQNVADVHYTRLDAMKRRLKSATAVAAFILALGVSRTLACSWGIGYFYQVTSLRGTVVGSKFPVLHMFRWFRQSVARPQAKLILYDYCRPCDTGSLAHVKEVFSDANGKFDFGLLKPSHYYLRVSDEKDSLSGWFEVEVKGPPNLKESESIDISPVNPDCTGGHEFIVRTN
jgi:hypothetical protein